MTVSLTYRAPFAPDGTHPIDAATCEKLLAAALANGGDYADLFFEYRAGGGLSFDEGILKSASRGVSLGLGVRVQRGDATGYAYVEDLELPAMLQAAKTAAQIAASGARVPAALGRIDLPRRYDRPKLSLDVPGIEKRALLEAAAKAGHAHHPSVVKMEASFAEEVREILIATSDGLMVHDIQPMLRFGVRAIAERDGKRQDGSSGGGGRVTMAYFDEKSAEWHARQAAAQAVAMLDAREAPAGQMEVVLAPGDSGILLHEAVGHGLEADFNRKGTSNYTNQIGQRVASELCTIVDDATLNQGRGAINVDDEGKIPQSSTLIENGILRGYMHDRLSARHFGIAPTGNGRRESFAYAPMPRMTNTFMKNGTDDPAELVTRVKDGIYAKSFGGGQVDITSGKFVFSCTEAYRIRNGKIAEPVKGATLIGDGPTVLTRVRGIGNDMALDEGIGVCGKGGQSVPAGVGQPTLLIDGLTVGGTAA